MTAGEDSLNTPIGDNRQLVNVLTAHRRKGFERWGFRRDGVELIKRTHDALYTCLRPVLAVDALQLMRCDQPNDLVVPFYDIAATAAAQQIFIDEVLQAHMTFHSRTVAVHDVGDAPPRSPAMSST